jgi:hypothetical protein
MARNLIQRPTQVEFEGQIYANIPPEILGNNTLLLQLMQTANANAAGGTVERTGDKVVIKPKVKRNG